jgi:hypothetical protein
MNDQKNGVGIAFGNVTVRAENYDIALVCLARALLDDDRFAAWLTAALRAPVTIAEKRSNQALAFC